MLKNINHYLFMLLLLGTMQVGVGHGSSDSSQNQEEPTEKVGISQNAPGIALQGSETAAGAAYADLAEKLPEHTEIKLISIEAVEWSDTSLGCPQEGIMYAQVIMPGYVLIFEAEGKQYQYHTDTSNQVISCDDR